MDDSKPWVLQSRILGEFIRSQRRLAKLSLRELADRTAVSNPYLSQIERGLHEPSLRVLKAIAEALDLSTDALLAQAGLLADEPADNRGGELPLTEAAIRTDPTLTEGQKTALLAVYRSYQEANRLGAETAVDPSGPTPAAGPAPSPRRPSVAERHQAHRRRPSTSPDIGPSDPWSQS
jgi:transcriptional regulator with XRE-family HTH domain